MRFEKKDIALLIPGTLLAIAGLGLDDPWVVGPCLFFSWVTFIVICVIHEGSRRTRALVGVVITVVLFGVGYRRFNSIYHATHETASKKDEPKSETPAKDERPKSEAQPNKLIKNPLEVVEFNSTTGISIANNDPTPVYIVDLLVSLKNPPASKTIQLGLDIGPGKVSKQALKGQLTHYQTLGGPKNDTWEIHYQKMIRRYGNCGIELVYFSVADTSFQQFRTFYENAGEALIFEDADAVLHYRVSGLHDTKTQKVSVVAILATERKCLDN
jgi:hypothetical protein